MPIYCIHFFQTLLSFYRWEKTRYSTKFSMFKKKLQKKIFVFDAIFMNYRISIRLTWFVETLTACICMIFHLNRQNQLIIFFILFHELLSSLLVNKSLCWTTEECATVCILRCINNVQWIQSTGFYSGFSVLWEWPSCI